MSPRFRKHPCYWRSLLLFHALPAEQQKNSRINILLDVHPDTQTWGHSWLTIDGKPAGRHRSQLKARIERIGSRGIYDYWVLIPVKVGQKDHS